MGTGHIGDLASLGCFTPFQAVLVFSAHVLKGGQCRIGHRRSPGGKSCVPATSWSFTSPGLWQGSGASFHKLCWLLGGAAILEAVTQVGGLGFLQAFLLPGESRETRMAALMRREKPQHPAPLCGIKCSGECKPVTAPFRCTTAGSRSHSQLRKAGHAQQLYCTALYKNIQKIIPDLYISDTRVHLLIAVYHPPLTPKMSKQNFKTWSLSLPFSQVHHEHFRMPSINLCRELTLGKPNRIN